MTDYISRAQSAQTVEVKPLVGSLCQSTYKFAPTAGPVDLSACRKLVYSFVAIFSKRVLNKGIIS